MRAQTRGSAHRQLAISVGRRLAVENLLLLAVGRLHHSGIERLGLDE
jgi:hypothetical protein